MSATDVRDGELIGEVRKNSRDVIRVTRKQWNGFDLVDVRCFEFGTNGELVATKRGVCAQPAVWRELAELVLRELGPEGDARV